MSQEEGSQQKALGCLAIIGLAVIIGVGGSLWDWISAPGADRVDIVVYAEINQSIINTLRLGGPQCDMTGYDLEILDSNGRRVAGDNLGKGLIDNAGIFCSFIMRTEVEEMEEYRIFIPVHSGDTQIASKTIPHEDALIDDGSLDIEVRWYNQRDGD